MSRFPEDVQWFTATVPDPGATGPPDYAAGLDIVVPGAPENRILARFAADVAHEHVGLYTPGVPLADLGPGGWDHVKRWQVSGGKDDTEVVYNAGPAGLTRHTIRGRQRAIRAWRTDKWVVTASVVDDEWIVTNTTAPKDSPARVIERIDLNTGESKLDRPTRFREVDSPTAADLADREVAYDMASDTMVFKRSDGTLRWWPCGTRE